MRSDAARMAPYPHQDLGGELELFVSIGDDGPGISPENMTKIFDPFYTTKPMGVGTDWARNSANRIVTEYGGSLRVTSEPGNTVS